MATTDGWFYRIGGQGLRGPVDLETLRFLLAKKTLDRDDVVWNPETPEWRLAGDVPELWDDTPLLRSTAVAASSSDPTRAALAEPKTTAARRAASPLLRHVVGRNSARSTMNDESTLTQERQRATDRPVWGFLISIVIVITAVVRGWPLVNLALILVACGVGGIWLSRILVAVCGSDARRAGRTFLGQSVIELTSASMFAGIIMLTIAGAKAAWHALVG